MKPADFSRKTLPIAIAVAKSVAALLCWALTSSQPAWASNEAPAPGAQLLNPEQQQWVKSHPIQSYAAEADYGPFIYTNPLGQPMGMSVDFLQLLSAKTGLQFTPQAVAPLTTILERGRQGTVDVITSLRATPERAQFLHFTTPYVSIPTLLILPAGQDPRTSLHAMRGRKVAVAKGYAVESFVREKYPQVQWLAFNSDADSLAQMIAGKVDGLVADAASVHFLLQQSKLPPVVHAAQVGFELPLSFACPKNKPELLAILQKGMQAISVAERDLLLQKWMPSTGTSGTPSSNNPRWLFAAAALVLLIALLLFVLRRRNAVAQH